MRARAFWIALVLGCSGPDAVTPESSEVGPTSASTRWVGVRAPSDTSLLEAPAVARVTADANAVVASTARVRVERVHVRPGSVVAAGDPVLEVTAPTLAEAAAAYLGARRRLTVHQQRAAELESLRVEGMVGRAEVFAQRALAAELRSERDRAAATLSGAGVDPGRAAALVRRGRLTLRAPVSGVVATLDARPGEIREPGGAPFAEIVGDGAARIEVRTSTSWPAATSLVFSTVDGRSVPLSPEPMATLVEPNDGTRRSWYAPLEAGARFPDGLRGVVRLTASEALWQVPVRAVAQRTGLSEVLRRRDGAVERVSVRVVTTSGAHAFVEGELREGDSVAADVARSDASEAGVDA